MPYTEVTLKVSDAIKGEVGKEYTFRQFGLLKPRLMANGKTNLMVTPAGWATYTKGEDAILFLRKKASLTGLQTTAALLHGKFKVSMSNATNQANNAGLFKNVQVSSASLSTNEQRALLTTTGPVNANAFIALVRQAVQNHWVEKRCDHSLCATLNWLSPFLIASIVMLSCAAFAGGPLIVDPNTRTAYTFGPGTVPVYYDLGNLGVVYDWNQNQVDLRQFRRQATGRDWLHLVVQYPNFVLPCQRHRRFFADRAAQH